MLKTDECRKLADHYRGRINEKRPTPRLTNVLGSVANAYLVLASQLDLLEMVESQDTARANTKDHP